MKDTEGKIHLPTIEVFPRWERWMMGIGALGWSGVEIWGAISGVLSVKELEFIALWFSLFYSLLFYSYYIKSLPRLFYYIAVIIGLFPISHFFIHPTPLFLSKEQLIEGGLTILLLMVAGFNTKNGFFSLLVGVLLLFSLVAGELSDQFPKLTMEQLALNLFYSNGGLWGTPLQVTVKYIFLFVLLGYLMEELRVGEVMIYIFSKIFQSDRGGIAKASVLTSILIGTFSSSSTANALITGIFTIPAMVNSGIPRLRAAAIEAAASTNSQLMPPIMGVAAFLIAETLNIDYSQVVIAAIVPAIMLFFGLYFIIDLISSQWELKSPRLGQVPFIKLKAVGFLLFFLGFVVTIGFRLLPIELVASYSILFLIGLILVVNLLGHRGEPLLRRLWFGVLQVTRGLLRGSLSSAVIVVITGMAGVVTTLLTLVGMPEFISNLIPNYPMSFHTFLITLILIAFLGIITGIGLPTTATYLVLASFIVPFFFQITSNSNIYLPLLAIHFFIFYFGILADIIPPTGITLYGVGSIAGVSPLKVGWEALKLELRTMVIPFLFLLNPYFLLLDPETGEIVTSPVLIGAILASAIGGVYSFTHLIYKPKKSPTEIVVYTGGVLLCWWLPSISLYLIPKALLQYLGGYLGLALLSLYLLLREIRAG